MRGLKKILFVMSWLALVPASASAQTALAGIVKDTSGAVLPGVTVEASSPSLIEKTRSTVTDSTGQYRLPELTPGIYTLSFTLPGFATIRRDNIDVTGAGVTTINADMRVGAVSETITVTGETPVVDIQTSTRRQVVLTNAVIEMIPASRGYGNLLATVPGIQATGMDIGAGVSTNFFTSRWARQRRHDSDRRDERRLGVQRRWRGGLRLSHRRGV